MAMNPPAPHLPVHVQVHVHGGQPFVARVASLLPPDVEGIPTSTTEDLVLALSSRGGGVIIADQADLAPGRPVAHVIADGVRGHGQADSAASSIPPVLALDCADAAAVAAALAAGATLALRADASPAEIASAVHALARDRELLRLVDLLRVDIEHQRLLLMKDDLTAAGNRRFFDFFVSEAVEKARATAGVVSLVFMDIDNLKSVNVRHGHSMGSLVLREAAARLIAGLDPSDRVMRYGGDEFCIVLPGVDASAAVLVAEKIQRDLAASPFVVSDTGGVCLTASFGVAQFPIHADDAAGLVRAADAAMLAIKDQKNGIQVAARP